MEREGEAFDDTIHLFGDKLKEGAGHTEDVEHQAVETAKDTSSNILSGIVHDISSASQRTRSVGADVLHSSDENARNAMRSFKGEFDDVVHDVLDTTHHATDVLKNTLQKADTVGDAFKGQQLKVNLSCTCDLRHAFRFGPVTENLRCIILGCLITLLSGVPGKIFDISTTAHLEKDLSSCFQMQQLKEFVLLKMV